MEYKLEHLFKLQEEFQKRFFDYDSMTEIEKQHATVDMVGHLVEETGEFRAEFPARKHWRKNNIKPKNERKAFLEYVDMWHFLINIGLINGWDASDVYKMFLKKHQVNKDRQDKHDY